MSFSQQYPTIKKVREVNPTKITLYCMVSQCIRLTAFGYFFLVL
uniref:Uncharacterized protein n=1 Tax=Klebsiella pneumoniae TaxID=573 RepID=A0A8B0STL0_KLEPN|nr:hypothetical protein [Klebsiella pneumoniae]